MKRLALAVTVFALLGVAFIAGWILGKGPAAAMVALTTKDAGMRGEWEKLEVVAAFDEFTNNILSVRDMIVAESETEQEVIQGMRFILRNLSLMTSVSLDGNLTRPRFVRTDSDDRKIAANNPDAEYAVATIDGRYDYRIEGNRGSVTYFSLNVTAGRGFSDRRLIAFLNDRTIEFDEEGNFTLLLSKSRPSEKGQWVPITEDVTSVMLRQYILDREGEELVAPTIAILGDDPGVHLPNDSEMAERLTATAYGFSVIASLHKLVLPQAMDTPNTFIETDSDELGGTISGPDNLYMLGHWRIEDDEALVVEVQPPDTIYWNLTLESIWHESIDYMHITNSLTKADVAYRDDGSVLFVIAKSDPGVPNWLNTGGVNRGFMTFRWLDARDIDLGQPVVTRVKLDQARKMVSGS